MLLLVEVEEENSEEETEKLSLEEAPTHPLAKRTETRLRAIKRGFEECIFFFLSR